MKKLAILILAGVSCVSAAAAEEQTFDSYCNLADYPESHRETHVIIDAALITPEPGGPIEENKDWRQRVTNLMNVSEPGALKRWDARERVTVSIAEGDGSGLRTVFSGCMPLYNAKEEKELSDKTSAVSKFIGSDWKRKLEKDEKEFRRKLTFSLVTAAKNITTPEAGKPFTESSLGQAINRGYRPSYQYGTPRLIIVTDLSNYKLPDGTTPELRAEGRKDADAWGADFGRSEVHLLGASSKTTASQNEYLKALFLEDKGLLKTITGLNGTLLVEEAPASIHIYQGLITYPDGKYPMTMRLALDNNRRAVNSWIEVQSDQLRFVPLEGALSCVGEASCTFVDTGDFAQIWSDDPGGEPEFENRMPFVGFRDISFELKDGKIDGKITDSSGYVPGMEDGLAFQMVEVENGAF